MQFDFVRSLGEIIIIVFLKTLPKTVITVESQG